MRFFTNHKDAPEVLRYHSTPVLQLQYLPIAFLFVRLAGQNRGIFGKLSPGITGLTVETGAAVVVVVVSIVVESGLSNMQMTAFFCVQIAELARYVLIFFLLAFKVIHASPGRVMVSSFMTYLDTPSGTTGRPES